MTLASLDLAFILKFLINLLSLALLIRLGSRRLRFNTSVFPFYMFGIGIFLVAFTLNRIDLTLGFAFGLFAIFSMLRYRTEVISLEDMTYLFLVVVIALICAVSPLSILELTIVCAIVVLSAGLAGSSFARSNLETQTIRYEKIENIRPENRAQLLADLKARTGLDVRSVLVRSIDLMQDSAMITVIHATPEKGP